MPLTDLRPRGVYLDAYTAFQAAQPGPFMFTLADLVQFAERNGLLAGRTTDQFARGFASWMRRARLTSPTGQPITAFFRANHKSQPWKDRP